MKKIFMIVSLIMMLLTCYQVVTGQSSNQTVVAGFNSDDNVGKITFFDANNLNVIKKLEFKNLSVNELKVFKNASIERIFVGGGLATGLTVIDLKTGQIITKILKEDAVSTIEADSKNIYVVNGVSVLFIIDPESLEIKKMVNLSSSRRETGDIVAMKDGILILRLFFTDKKKNLLRISTMDSNGIEKTVIGEVKVNFRLGFGNMKGSISVDERKMYIPSENRVTELNLVSGKRVSFRTNIRFTRECYFDDATKTICVISTSSTINLIDRKTKTFQEFKVSNEINEVLNAGTATGDNNGHLFINFYKVKAGIGILTMVNLRDESSVMNEYERFGDTSGIDLVK